MSVRAIALCVVAVILIGVGGGLVAHLMGWRLHHAEAQRDTARDAAQSSGLEVTGAANVATKAAAGQDAVDAQRKAADNLNNEARHDPTAQTQLPASSLDRLRAGDRQLCSSGHAKCAKPPS